MSKQTCYTCDAYELGCCTKSHDKSSPFNCVMNIKPRRGDWIWCGNGNYPSSICSNTIGPEGNKHWHRTCDYAYFVDRESNLYRISVWEVDYDPRSSEGVQLVFPFIQQERRYRNRYDF